MATKKTGASLLPIVVKYNSKYKEGAQLKIYNELVVDKQQNIDSITQKVYSTLEYFILQTPEKWSLWLDYHLMLSTEARKR